ncbi:MAG: hypothetical protein IE933_12590 [Sphingomonadales bacterium]|nr:hypothetical protein [Sphingomonadales bacterium]MBD3774664.1 hypothetical protein [Paracoccaceae bacterium]
MTEDATQAAEALASVRASHARLAARSTVCPPWRHAAFGAIFALLVGSIAISSQVQFMAMPVIVAGIIGLLRYDRKRYGMFINGYRRGKTLPVTLAYVGAMMVMVVAAMHMRTHDFTDASKAGLAAIAFAMAIAFSLVWHRVYLAELTGTQQ